MNDQYLLAISKTPFSYRQNSEILLKWVDLRPDYSIFTYKPDFFPRLASDAPKVKANLLLRRSLDSMMRMEGGVGLTR